MVRCSTIYDKSINKKVFMIRGDENYTHSTTTLLEEVSRVTSKYDYLTVTFKMNVLRDSGESNIAVYDNNVLIDLISWNDTLGSVTSTYNLNWGVEHNIKAKYMGNNSCLTSTSNIISINDENPNLYETKLIRNDSTTQYKMDISGGTKIPIKVTLQCPSESKIVKNQSLDIYIGNILVTTQETNENGEIDYTSRPLVPGKHNIQIKYNGHDNVSGSSLSYNIAIGYKLQIIECPDVLVYGNSNKILVKLSDYYDNPLTNKEIELWHTWLNNTFFATYISATTDSQGIAEFTIGNTENVKYEYSNINLYFRCKDSEESTQKLKVPCYYPDKILFLSSESMISSNNSTRLKIGLQKAIENVAVTLTRNSEPFETLYTNSRGTIEYNYQGSAMGKTDFTVYVGDVMESVTIEDVYQYWSIHDNIELNRSFYAFGDCAYGKQTNGYMMASLGAGECGYVLDNVLDGNWTLTFDVVSVNNNNLRLVVGNIKAIPSDTNILNMNYMNTYRMDSVILSNGCKVKLKYADKSLKVYVDGNYKGNVSQEFNKYPAFGFAPTSVGNTVYFNNVKLIKE